MRLLLSALLVGSLLATGCGSADDEAAAPTAPTATGTAPAAREPAAPTIAGTTLDGERISLASFRGRPVLINVWSSW